MTNGRIDQHGKAGSPALRLAAWVDRIVTVAAATVALSSIIAIFLALLAEVLSRYLTTRGLGWPTEVPNILFPWLVMGGIVLAAHRGAHIAVSILLYALTPAAAKILLAAMQILVAATFIFLSYASIAVVQITGNQLFPVTGIPQLYAYSSMFFGFGGIAIISLVTLVRVLHATDPRSVLDESAEASV